MKDEGGDSDGLGVGALKAVRAPKTPTN